MAVKTTIDRLDLTDLLSDMTPSAQSASIAGFAKVRLAEAQAVQKRAGGRAARFKVTVDGRAGASIDSVRPRGVIVIEFELVTELLAWIAQALWDRSPVGSGRYRSAHTIYADGNPVGTFAGGALPSLPEALEYSFSNPEPYTRKIEVGVTRSGRSFVMQVPNRIYERTAHDASARFGNVARITFGFSALNSGAISDWAHSPSARRLASRVRRGNPARHTEWLTSAPTITVRTS